MDQKEKKINALLGFARRAGYVFAGSSNVEANIRKERVFLLLVTEDISPRREKNWKIWGEKKGVPVIKLQMDKTSLGILIGMSPRQVIGIGNEMMAENILKIFNS